MCSMVASLWAVLRPAPAGHFIPSDQAQPRLGQASSVLRDVPVTQRRLVTIEC